MITKRQLSIILADHTRLERRIRQIHNFNREVYSYFYIDRSKPLYSFSTPVFNTDDLERLTSNGLRFVGVLYGNGVFNVLIQDGEKSYQEKELCVEKEIN